MGFIPDERYIRGLMYEEYQERPEKERLVPAIPSEFATGKYSKY